MRGKVVVLKMATLVTDLVSIMVYIVVVILHLTNLGLVGHLPFHILARSFLSISIYLQHT